MKKICPLPFLLLPLTANPYAVTFFSNSSKSDLDLLISAIVFVESSNNPSAFNQKEQARGYFQIRPIMVEEANRLQSKKVYKLEDCWDFDKSKEIFLIYQNQYSADYSLERIARNWNGGPSGYKKDSTLPYWNKVESKFKELKIKYYEERSFY